MDLSFTNLSLFSIGAAILAALSGSIHCAAMCGPLRVIVGNRTLGRVQYQLGRLLAYMGLGLLSGTIGAYLLSKSAIVFIALALLFLAIKQVKIVKLKSFTSKLHVTASQYPFLFGLSSGLLPCGMLHLWVIAAAASGSKLNAVVFLTILWIGSLPALEFFSQVTRKYLAFFPYPKLLPYLIVLIALIPFLYRSQFTQLMGISQAECHYSEK